MAQFDTVHCRMAIACHVGDSAALCTNLSQQQGDCFIFERRVKLTL